MNNNIKTRHEQCSGKACAEGTSQNKGTIKKFPPAAGKVVLKGSLTVEASLCLPLFMMFCAALISFIVILCLQLNIQVQMEETARVMGQAAFLAGHADSVTGDISSVTDEREMSLMSAGINNATIKLALSGDSTFAGRINRSRIIGGFSGLYTHESSFDEDAGIIDIVVSYDYSVPWVPQDFGRIRQVQRMFCHAWTGSPVTGGLDGNAAGNGKQDGHTVYVTPTGTVYHTDPSCHYLDLSIRATSYDTVSSERNVNGARYERCSHCAQSGDYDTVYITDYGTNWHSSLSCSGLKRTVIEKDISEVQDMRMCSKCANGSHDHEHD